MKIMYNNLLIHLKGKNTWVGGEKDIKDILFWKYTTSA